MTLPDLATERLWLRPMAIGDAGDLHAARGDPEAMRWWYAGVSPSIEDTRAEIANMATWGTSWSFGRHGSGDVLGYVGFHGLGADEACGFGYFLRRSEWGSGLVAEASRAALAYGFDTVGIRHAELWIDPGNAQSVRLAEKLGARFRGWAHTGPLSLIHGITAAEWRGDGSPPSTINVVPVIGVTDVAAAMRLWCDGLGFRAGWSVGEPPQLGHVFAQWTGGPGVRLVVGGARSAISMQVGTNVDVLVRRAEAAGWIIESAPADQDWGTRDATIADADGNRVVLAGAIA